MNDFCMLNTRMRNGAYIVPLLLVNRVDALPASLLHCGNSEDVLGAVKKLVIARLGALWPILLALTQEMAKLMLSGTLILFLFTYILSSIMFSSYHTMFLCWSGDTRMSKRLKVLRPWWVCFASWNLKRPREWLYNFFFEES